MVTKDQSLLIGGGVLLLALVIAGVLYVTVQKQSSGGGSNTGGNTAPGLYYIDGMSLKWKSYADAIDTVMQMGTDASVATYAEAKACSKQPPSGGYVASGRLYKQATSPVPGQALGGALPDGIFVEVETNRKTPIELVKVQFTGDKTTSPETFWVLSEKSPNVLMTTVDKADTFYKIPAGPNNEFILVASTGEKRGATVFVETSFSSDSYVRADTVTSLTRQLYSTVMVQGSSSEVYFVDETTQNQTAMSISINAEKPGDIYSPYSDYRAKKLMTAVSFTKTS